MRAIKIILAIVATLITTWFSGCASINSPKGGPVDSLPPTIKSTDPAQYATNFKGKRVTIDFNEYVQLKDQQKLFFVSPEGKKKPQLTIKGRSIVVDFQDSMIDNQTYRLDFGSSIADNNESNKLDGYKFTFSTGPQVDSMVMAGQVLYAQSRDTVIGAFVPYFDVATDSTYAERGLDSTLFKSRAEALFRTDSSGFIVADILKEKPYRIYAINDKNGNQRYEAGSDMVAFIDSTFNPADMPPFMFGYDSTTRRLVIDSVQFTLEVFPEVLTKRQMLSTQSRVNRTDLQLQFNAHYPTIDSFSLDSIPSEWLIEDKVPTGDTVTYWINTPTPEAYEALPDTIRGRMIYQKQDSIMQFQPDTVKLLFTHIDQIKKEKQAAAQKEAEKAQKEAERAEKNRDKKSNAQKENKAIKEKNEDEEEVPTADSTAKEPNPFGFKVLAASELNPEHNIVLTFDYPIISIDSAGIKLTEVVTEQARGARRGSTEQGIERKTDVPINVKVDNLRQITLSSAWKTDGKYELMIPAATFKNSIHQSNDTLKSSFSILNPDKFGTITFKTKADTLTTDTTQYIFELVTISYNQNKTEQKVVATTKNVRAGDEIKYRFLTPGDYYLRITRDDDRNGEWTTGDLRARRHPERVRFLTDRGTRLALKGKEGWDVSEIVDITEVMKGK